MIRTVRELAELMNLDVMAGEGGLDNPVSGMYICDLLSWVMGKAQEGDMWVTIQGHVNIVAVALLTVVSCIVVCESAEVMDQTISKANDENIPLLRSELTAYRLAERYIALTNGAL